MQRVSPQRTAMDSSLDCSIYQSCSLEYSEMLRYSRKRHIERCGEIGNDARPVGKAGDECPASSIRQGVENPVKLIVARNVRGYFS
jgi:hypothetical protein